MTTDYDIITVGGGLGGAALAMRALPLIAQDQDRFHDAFMSGPDCAPVEEAARRHFFGED